MSEPVFLKRTIVKQTLWSEQLQEERKLRIYLPPGYNEVLSYPVIYCQDGEEFFNFGRIATLAGQLIIEEDIEPFIIVGVEVNVAVRTQEYAPSAAGSSSTLPASPKKLFPSLNIIIRSAALQISGLSPEIRWAAVSPCISHWPTPDCSAAC